MGHLYTVYAETEHINIIIKQVLNMNVLTAAKRHPTLKLRTTDGDVIGF
jgi:hypothetical protein